MENHLPYLELYKHLLMQCKDPVPVAHTAHFLKHLLHQVGFGGLGYLLMQCKDPVPVAHTAHFLKHLLHQVGFGGLGLHVLCFVLGGMPVRGLGFRVACSVLSFLRGEFRF